MTHRFPLMMSIGVWSLLFTGPAVSRADILLFSNFGPGLSYDTGDANLVGNAFDGNNYAEGDTFTPTTSGGLSSITIALSCFGSGSCPDNFTVSLTRNASGAPASALESFTVSGASLGIFGANNPPLVLDSLLHPLLTAGTQYWVTVRSDLNDSIAWNWNSTGDASDQAISADGGATWFAPSGLTPGAYKVNATPEPAGVVLFSTVFLLALGKSRRLLRNR
jgi:hypothetical protein